MKFSAEQIAQVLEGKVEGDSDVEVSNIAKIEEATSGTLAFLANPKYEKYIYSTNASIVLVNEDFKPSEAISATLIRVKSAYTAFAALMEMVQMALPSKTGIDSSAIIDESAQLGENVYVGAFTYIGKNVKIGNNTKIYPQVYIGDNVTIGNDTTLHPGVKVYELTQIGNECIVHGGTIIGSDGFGFAPQSGEDYKKIHHMGNVIIHNRVELGSNITIDRATLGSTIIKDGVKLDNLVQVAHNVEVGERTVMASQSGFAGSAKVGKDCLIGGQVGVGGHLTVADGVKIAGKSGITASAKIPGQIIRGIPAMPIDKFNRAHILHRKLPEMETRLRELEALVKKLTENAE